MRLINDEKLIHAIKMDPFGGLNYESYIQKAPDATFEELKEEAKRLGFNISKRPQKTGKKKPCPVCGRRPTIQYNFYALGLLPMSSIIVKCPNDCIPEITVKRHIECVDEKGNKYYKRLPKYETEAEATKQWNEEVEKYERRGLNGAYCTVWREH